MGSGYIGVITHPPTDPITFDPKFQQDIQADVPILKANDEIHPTQDIFGTNIQGTIGRTPNSVGPMVLIGLIWGFLGIITHKHPRVIGIYRAYIGISHDGVRW